MSLASQRRHGDAGFQPALNRVVHNLAAFGVGQMFDTPQPEGCDAFGCRPSCAKTEHKTVRRHHQFADCDLLRSPVSGRGHQRLRRHRRGPRGAFRIGPDQLGPRPGTSQQFRTSDHDLGESKAARLRRRRRPDQLRRSDPVSTECSLVGRLVAPCLDPIEVNQQALFRLYDGQQRDPPCRREAFGVSVVDHQIRPGAVRWLGWTRRRRPATRLLDKSCGWLLSCFVTSCIWASTKDNPCRAEHKYSHDRNHDQRRHCCTPSPRFLDSSECVRRGTVRQRAVPRRFRGSGQKPSSAVYHLPQDRHDIWGQDGAGRIGVCSKPVISVRKRLSKWSDKLGLTILSKVAIGEGAVALDEIPALFGCYLVTKACQYFDRPRILNKLHRSCGKLPRLRTGSSSRTRQQYCADDCCRFHPVTLGSFNSCDDRGFDPVSPSGDRGMTRDQKIRKGRSAPLRSTLNQPSPRRRHVPSSRSRPTTRTAVQIGARDLADGRSLGGHDQCRQPTQREDRPCSVETSDSKGAAVVFGYESYAVWRRTRPELSLPAAALRPNHKKRSLLCQKHARLRRRRVGRHFARSRLLQTGYGERKRQQRDRRVGGF